MANYTLSEIEQLIDDQTFIFGVLSNVKNGVEKTYNKVDIKPVMIKNEWLYQISCYYDQKVKHENLTPEGIKVYFAQVLGPYFKQGQL